MDSNFSTTRLITRQKPAIEESTALLFLPDTKGRKGEGGLRKNGYYKKTYPNKPLISIVTVVYNGDKFLEKAIQSVINQTYENVEFIIIDGGSTDNSVDIIKKYEAKVDYWVSEDDSGQSDAFNKGFSLCQGELVSWVNGDDILLPGAIKEVVNLYNRKPSLNWIVGNVLWMTEDEKLILCRKGESWNSYLVKCGVLNVYGPTSFFTLDLFNKVGKLQSWMHYRMDTDLWWRFVTEGEKFERLEGYTWALRVHKDAKTTGKYFKDSELSSENHPSQIQMKKEDNYIAITYQNNCFLRKILLYMIRISTFRYVMSIVDSFRFRNCSYTKVLSNNT